ncbi:putative HD phosphohydrolase [Ameyamaea chiangmaiensis NBRC 103196]|uniref:HD domain-containing protein n=1 Tax=Ameyamaea chiangmaiensis TaxID=442969 RepID=A0A850PAW4_9PROT|nr:HD domain-containing protein [Ameyamaea chiangmaiensis]MBS4076054.1 HD domain-containing protein [Ameyamaea chiangmaiensis]NVN39829.1 HD domain-containing protein [Ameyamaea chiangmaiensis]GBQ66850.1 putative HD phosphohydrolase [Ameyamaea chiangmaiensis NBRC 103196]
MFRSFDESTADDWVPIGVKFDAFQGEITSHIIGALKLLATLDLGYPIDRYQHSLQTATRALRDGADDETLVCALLHDVGDALAPTNHGAFAATMLAPYISPDNAWMVENHEAFQGYYYAQYFGGDPNARAAFRGHPAFERTVRFTDTWDQKAFDSGYDTLPLDAFIPALNRIFSRPAWGPHSKAGA